MMYLPYFGQDLNKSKFGWALAHVWYQPWYIDKNTKWFLLIYVPFYRHNQGCGGVVETGVGVDRSRPFCLESESELESVKFRRLRLRPGVAGYQPSTDNDFWPNGYASSRYHWKQDEKESGSVEIMLKRNLAIEFRLIKGIEDNFGVTSIILQIQGLSYRAPKEK